VSGFLPVLARLLSTTDEEVLVDALWAISYLSDDQGSNNNKIQAVIDAGIAQRLVELLSHASAAVKVHTANC
jgi:hypothetical protein